MRGNKRKRAASATKPRSSQMGQGTSRAPAEQMDTGTQQDAGAEDSQSGQGATQQTTTNEAGLPVASSSSTSSRHVTVQSKTGPVQIQLETSTEESSPEPGLVIDLNPVQSTEEGNKQAQQLQLEDKTAQRLEQADTVLNRHCRRGKLQQLRPPPVGSDAKQMLLKISAQPQMTALVDRARAMLGNTSQGPPLSRTQLYTALQTINHETEDTNLFKDTYKPSDTYVVAAHMYVYSARYVQQWDTLSKIWAVHMILSQLYMKYEQTDHRMLERLVEIPSHVYPHTVNQAVDLATNWDFAVSDTNKHSIEPVPDTDNPPIVCNQDRATTNAAPRHARPSLQGTQQLTDSWKRYHTQLKSDNPMLEGTKIKWRDLRYLLSNKLALTSVGVKEMLGNTQIHYTESTLQIEQAPVEDTTDEQLAEHRTRLQLKLRKDCTTQSVNGAEYELVPSQRPIDPAILLQIMNSENIKPVISAQRPGYELAFSTDHATAQQADEGNMTQEQRNGYTLRTLPKGPGSTRRRRQQHMITRNAEYTERNEQPAIDDGVSQVTRTECAVVTHEVYLGYTTRPGIEFLEELGLLYGEVEANNQRQAGHLLKDIMQFTKDFPSERLATCTLQYMSHGAIRVMHIKTCQKVLELLKSLSRVRPDSQLEIQTLEQLHTVRAKLHYSLEVMEYYITRLHNCYQIHWSPTELMVRLDRLRSSNQQNKRTFLAPVDDVRTNEDSKKPIAETWTAPIVPLGATLVNVANEHEIDDCLTYIRGDCPFPFNMKHDAMIYLACWGGSHSKYRKELEPEALQVMEPLYGATRLEYGDFIRERAYVWTQAQLGVNYQLRMITHAPAAGILHVLEPLTSVKRTLYTPTLAMGEHDAPGYTAAVNIKPYLRPAPPSNDPDLRMEQANTDLYGFFRSNKEGSETLTVRSQAEPTPHCELNPRAPVPVINLESHVADEWTEQETGGQPMPLPKPPLSRERAASKLASNVNYKPMELTNEQGRLFMQAVQSCFIKEGDSKPSIDRRKLARMMTMPIAEGLQSLPSAIHNFTLLTGRPPTAPGAYTMARDAVMVDEIVTQIRKGMEQSCAVGFTINMLRVDDQLRSQFEELRKPDMTAEEQEVAHKHYSHLLIKHAGYIPDHLAQFNPDIEQYMALIAGFSFALHDGTVYIIPAHVAVRPDSYCQLQLSLYNLLNHTETAKGAYGGRLIMYRAQEQRDLFERSFAQPLTDRFIDWAECTEVYGFKRPTHIHNTMMAMVQVPLIGAAVKSQEDLAEDQLNISGASNISDATEFHSTNDEMNEALCSPVLGSDPTNDHNPQPYLSFHSTTQDIKHDAARCKANRAAAYVQATLDLFMLSAAVNPQLHQPQWEFHAAPILMAQKQLALGFAGSFYGSDESPAIWIWEQYEKERKRTGGARQLPVWPMAYAIYMHTFQHAHEALNRVTTGTRPTPLEPPEDTAREQQLPSLDVYNDVTNQYYKQVRVASMRLIRYKNHEPGYKRQPPTTQQLRQEWQTRVNDLNTDIRSPYGESMDDFLDRCLPRAQRLHIHTAHTNWIDHDLKVQAYTNPSPFTVSETRLTREGSRPQVTRMRAEQFIPTVQDVEIISRQASRNMAEMLWTVLSAMPGAEHEATKPMVYLARFVSMLQRQFMQALIVLHTNEQISPLALKYLGDIAECHHDLKLAHERTMLMITSPATVQLPTAATYIGNRTLYTENRQRPMTIEHREYPKTMTAVYHVISPVLQQLDRSELYWSFQPEPDLVVLDTNTEKTPEGLMQALPNKIAIMDMLHPTPTNEYRELWASELDTSPEARALVSKWHHTMTEAERMQEWSMCMKQHAFDVAIRNSRPYRFDSGSTFEQQMMEHTAITGPAGRPEINRMSDMKMNMGYLNRVFEPELREQGHDAFEPLPAEDAHYSQLRDNMPEPENHVNFDRNTRMVAAYRLHTINNRVTELGWYPVTPERDVINVRLINDEGNDTITAEQWLATCIFAAHGLLYTHDYATPRYIVLEDGRPMLTVRENNVRIMMAAVPDVNALNVPYIYPGESYAIRRRGDDTPDPNNQLIRVGATDLILWKFDTIPNFDNAVPCKRYVRVHMGLFLMAVCCQEGLCFKCYKDLPENMNPAELLPHEGCEVEDVINQNAQCSDFVLTMRCRHLWPGFEQYQLEHIPSPESDSSASDRGTDSKSTDSSDNDDNDDDDMQQPGAGLSDATPSTPSSMSLPPNDNDSDENPDNSEHADSGHYSFKMLPNANSNPLMSQNVHGFNPPIPVPDPILLLNNYSHQPTDNLDSLNDPSSAEHSAMSRGAKHGEPTEEDRMDELDRQEDEQEEEMDGKGKEEAGQSPPRNSDNSDNWENAKDSEEESEEESEEDEHNGLERRRDKDQVEPAEDAKPEERSRGRRDSEGQHKASGDKQNDRREPKQRDPARAKESPRPSRHDSHSRKIKGPHTPSPVRKDSRDSHSKSRRGKGPRTPSPERKDSRASSSTARRSRERHAASGERYQGYHPRPRSICPERQQRIRERQEKDDERRAKEEDERRAKEKDERRAKEKDERRAKEEDERRAKNRDKERRDRAEREEQEKRQLAIEAHHSHKPALGTYRKATQFKGSAGQRSPPSRFAYSSRETTQRQRVSTHRNRSNSPQQAVHNAPKPDRSHEIALLKYEMQTSTLAKPSEDKAAAVPDVFSRARDASIKRTDPKHPGNADGWRFLASFRRRITPKPKKDLTALIRWLWDNKMCMYCMESGHNMNECKVPFARRLNKNPPLARCRELGWEGVPDHSSPQAAADEVRLIQEQADNNDWRDYLKAIKIEAIKEYDMDMAAQLYAERAKDPCILQTPAPDMPMAEPLNQPQRLVVDKRSATGTVGQPPVAKRNRQASVEPEQPLDNILLQQPPPVDRPTTASTARARQPERKVITQSAVQCAQLGTPKASVQPTPKPSANTRVHAAAKGDDEEKPAKSKNFVKRAGSTARDMLNRINKPESKKGASKSVKEASKDEGQSIKQEPVDTPKAEVTLTMDELKKLLADQTELQKLQAAVKKEPGSKRD